ncbi:MAG: hypothetical protein ACK4LR_12230 [Acidovorax temperans]
MPKTLLGFFLALGIIELNLARAQPGLNLSPLVANITQAVLHRKQLVALRLCLRALFCITSACLLNRCALGIPLGGCRSLLTR